VAKRLEKLLEGESVPPINDNAAGPSFVSLNKDAPSLHSGGLAAAAAAAAATAPSTLKPRTQNTYEEPDEEAIEMKLDNSSLSQSQYVTL